MGRHKKPRVVVVVVMVEYREREKEVCRAAIAVFIPTDAPQKDTRICVGSGRRLLAGSSCGAALLPSCVHLRVFPLALFLALVSHSPLSLPSPPTTPPSFPFVLPGAGLFVLGNDDAEIYGYAAAFPFFETWQPARDDLWEVAKATLVSSAVLSAVVLEPWTGMSTVLGIVSGASALLVIMVNILDGDLNLVTAVNVYLASPVLCSCLFYVAFRFSAFIAFLGSAREARHVFRKFLWELLVPGVAGPFFAFGAAVTVFFWAKSPLNIIFTYL